MAKKLKSVADMILALSYVYLLLCLVAGIYLLVVFGELKNPTGIFISIGVVVHSFIVQQVLRLVSLFVVDYVDRNFE